MNYLNLTVAILVGYIVGSIPWALIVGKVFYGVDVRKHGSGNLGGTNVLRTLGKVPGISVMVLDALKALLFMAVLHLLKMDDIVPFAGLAVLIGHCFPVFANFKGGKAVASAVGYVLAVNLFVEKQLLLCWLLPMLIFVTVLFTTRYMSLASITVVSLFAITALIFYQSKINALLIVLLALFVIYKHKDNINRLKEGTEKRLGSKKQAV